MFENCSTFVLTNKTSAPKVYRVNVTVDTQIAICHIFSDAQDKLTANKERILFNGLYKPNEDEYLAIENFQIDDEIKDAIRNPLGTPSYQKENGVFPEIKAIFVGESAETAGVENYNIAFQKFRKEQYISPQKFNLFFSNDTFFRQKELGICISDNIDCYYTSGELQFQSFYWAKQIFNLRSYFRSATDSEILSFASNAMFDIDDLDAFKAMADTWVRRKVALINDSKILDSYSVSDIIKRAEQIGLDISTEGSRIVLPNDKKKMKVILGFLDEEAYKGPFSQNLYLTNSKRQVK